MVGGAPGRKRSMEQGKIGGPESISGRATSQGRVGESGGRRVEGGRSRVEGGESRAREPRIGLRSAVTTNPLALDSPPSTLDPSNANGSPNRTTCTCRNNCAHRLFCLSSLLRRRYGTKTVCVTAQVPAAAVLAAFPPILETLPVPTSKSKNKKTSTKAKKASKRTSPQSSRAKKKSPKETEVTIDRRRKSRRAEDREEASEAAPPIERREKVQRRRQIDPTTCERDYTESEVEFMNAMDEYKRTSGRMFPTCSEVLEVIRALGYVKLSSAELTALGRTPIDESEQSGDVPSDGAIDAIEAEELEAAAL